MHACAYVGVYVCMCARMARRKCHHGKHDVCMYTCLCVVTCVAQILALSGASCTSLQHQRHNLHQLISSTALSESHGSQKAPWTDLLPGERAFGGAGQDLPNLEGGTASGRSGMAAPLLFSFGISPCIVFGAS